MDVALIGLQAFLVVGALSAFYQLVIARHYPFGLWLVVNTCSPVSLLFVGFHVAGLALPAYFMAGAMFLYGAYGLMLFGVRRLRMIFVPQLIHVVMIGANVLLLIQTPGVWHWVAWLAGLAGGLLVLRLQHWALTTRPIPAVLSQDPVMGPTFGRLAKKAEPPAPSAEGKTP